MDWLKQKAYWVFAISIAFILLIYYIWSHFYLYETDAYVESNIVVVSPEVEGRIKHLYINDLDKIHKNQLLFEIDDTPYVAAKQSAEADLLQANNLLMSLKAQQQSAQAAISKADADLKFRIKEYKRFQSLNTKEFASQQQEDSSYQEMQQAQGAYLMAKANLQNVMAQLGDPEQEFAPIKNAKAKLKSANYQLSHTKYRSLVDGYVTSMLLSEGDYVKPGQSLFALIDNAKWWIVMNVKESYLSYLDKNNSATIWLPSVSGKKFYGKVYGAAWAVNRKQDSSNAAKSVLPYLKKTENWIQLEQRFPVRIPFEPKGQSLHYGANAKVLVRL